MSIQSLNAVKSSTLFVMLLQVLVSIFSPELRLLISCSVKDVSSALDSSNFPVSVFCKDFFISVYPCRHYSDGECV